MELLGTRPQKMFLRSAEKESEKMGAQRLKKLTDEKDKMKAKSQENCKYCEKPLLQKNFRDAEPRTAIATIYCEYIPKLRKYQLYSTT